MPAPIGVLLTNLGTPDTPEVADVRRYLKEFLSDRRVVKTSPLIWWPILNLIILNTRPRRSAAAYRKIWTGDGSPLLSISRDQAAGLQTVLDADGKGDFTVELAMRYGSPSVADAMDRLKRRGVEQLIVLPLYPQFSHTTTSSTLDAVEAAQARDPYPMSVRFVRHYYEHPDYIAALADSVLEHWAAHGRADKLIMSFHGIPRDYADAGDPYPDECRHTAALLADALELGEQDWMLTFQSRLGPKEWLQPYTDKTLESLAKSGTESVQIMCPGFSADCLETLEEVSMENREIFMHAGGRRYEYIPCLNTRADHLRLMASLVRQYAAM